MKTHTKIFIGYGILVLVFTGTMLNKSLKELHRMTPVATELCARLGQDTIKFLDFTFQGNDVEEAKSYPSFISKSRGDFYLSGYVESARISGDTLYLTHTPSHSQLNWMAGMVGAPDLQGSVIHIYGEDITKTY